MNQIRWRSKIVVLAMIGLLAAVQGCSASSDELDGDGNAHQSQEQEADNTSEPREQKLDNAADSAVSESQEERPESETRAAQTENRPALQPTALAKGEQPPQFVIISVDGACEMPSGVMSDMLDLGRDVQGRFTWFLSGLCLLPEQKRMQYRPPGKSRGSSDIGFGDANMIKRRLNVLAQGYRDGHEIGTHFLGHFCGATGVGTWSTKQWRSEIAQARKFLDKWPRFNPNIEVDPLPFNSTTWIGTRTPCLEGNRSQMLPAFIAEGFRYEASNPGALKWPTKMSGGQLWDFTLPLLNMSGSRLRVLAMDYNFMANQGDGKSSSDPSTCAKVEKQTRNTYLKALKATYNSSRAPLIIGAHMNPWSCNAYVKSLFDFVRTAKAKYPEVMFISFSELTDWLDAQKPRVLKALQKKPPVTDY